MVTRVLAGSQTAKTLQIPGFILSCVGLMVISPHAEFVPFAVPPPNIQNTIYADPPPELLRNLQESDHAILVPPPSKTDAFGVIWGDKPIYLPFRPKQPWNAAARLRNMELLHPCSRQARAATPLFSPDGLRPFYYSELDTVLKHLKLLVLPDTVDHSLYTYHSCRTFLCTQLGAAGVSNEKIQALCRWQSPQSLHIYGLHRIQ